MKALRIILGAHLIFFGAWGFYLLTSHQAGKYVWLETMPVDPRDYISGHYVALNFKIANVSTTKCSESTAVPGTIAYVRLGEEDQTLSVPEGVIRTWGIVDCRFDRPTGNRDETWMEGKFANQPWRSSSFIQYGIERFYVSEGSPLRNARSGDVVAKVSINKNFTPRIVDLVKIAKR
ncbi:MAG TPA: GDYXXLXY domain-containing protein [Bdellovibrionota bacterium]|nr:GDYXXLXY domain-containing protein [Bdellovibrionota bacterium]